MVKNSSYHNPYNLPENFAFDVKMVTRTRYKCAGWHIIKRSDAEWVKMIPGSSTSTKHVTLYNAVRTIVGEWRRLQTEVETIEAENGKVRS